MFQVKKRDGKIVEFDMSKISIAISKAFNAKGVNYTADILNMLTLRVAADFSKKIKDNIINVEDVQDSVEVVLIQAGYVEVAKSYILYRKQREKVRNIGSTLVDYKKVVDDYLKVADWRVKENSTVTYSVGGLILSNSGAVTANYWLSEVYDDEIGEICHDVELMRGELQFEKKQSMKMRENEKNLLACMSHDMKTPLFAISSHVEAIRDGIVSTEEEINQYIEVILNRVKIMEKLIEDILEHAEVEMQELSINPKNYFTTEFFPDIFEKIRQDFASHGNQVHLSEIPKYSLQIDPFRIQQVIFNIASNALKYSDNKTDLYITCNTLSLDKGTYFVVTMRDEGRGISASDLPFVFERFYRGEKARSSKIPGSGLGLHISKYIIEKHGGWIECDSVIGEGTTVSFSLPI